jgi:cytochrome c oxidase assembly protein subunit 15
MDASAQPLARLRNLGLSPLGFRRLAIANAAMLVVIVATGATVRLTASGLGCHHWPGCQPGEVLPAKGFHSYIEFSNRLIAFVTILVTLATWLFASRRRPLAFGIVVGLLLQAPVAALTYKHGPTTWLVALHLLLAAGVLLFGVIVWRAAGIVERLAIAVFAGTMAQAPLGALTVHFGLNPWLVLSHFLLSAVVLTLGVCLALETFPRMRSQLPSWVPRVGLLVSVSGAVLLFSGTLATAAGPHPGSTVVRRLWSFQPAIYWHVRATAVFGIAFAVLLVWLVRNRAPQVRSALVLLGLLLVQMVIGETQYRTHLPWWLVLVHVTVAVTVWAALTVFVYSLWRPRRMG